MVACASSRSASKMRVRAARRPAGTQQKQQQEEVEAPLEAWQQEVLDWYRNTCIVTGAGLAGAVWHWNWGGGWQRAAEHVFVPPRAQALPPEVVDGWRRSVRFKQGVRTVGRQTVFAAFVAGLYFGVEASARYARSGGDGGGEGGGGGGAAAAAAGGRAAPHWSDTALAGAVAGGYLGVLGEWLCLSECVRSRPPFLFALGRVTYPVSLCSSPNLGPAPSLSHLKHSKTLCSAWRVQAARDGTRRADGRHGACVRARCRERGCLFWRRGVRPAIV